MNKTLRRTGAALALTALVGSGTVALTATSAQAATEVATRVQLEPQYKWVTFGRNIGFTARAGTANGSNYYPDNGYLYLQRALPGKGWKNFQSSTSKYSNYFYFRGTTNAQYRACYTGGQDTYNNVIYKPSCSAGFRTGVRYKMTSRGFTSGRKAGFRGKVSPKFRGKVKYQTKRNGRWATIRKFKLTRGKKFSVIMNGRNRQVFRVFVPATKKNMSSWVSYRLYVYRTKTAAGTSAVRSVAVPIGSSAA